MTKEHKPVGPNMGLSMGLRGPASTATPQIARGAAPPTPEQEGACERTRDIVTLRIRRNLDACPYRFHLKRTTCLPAGPIKMKTVPHANHFTINHLSRPEGVGTRIARAKIGKGAGIPGASSLFQQRRVF